MKDHIVISKASIGTLNGIVQIVKETFPQDFCFKGKFSRGICCNLFKRAFKDPNELVYVAKQGKTVIGFVYYINKPPTNGTILLEMIGVRRKFQGKGFGLKLITEGDDLAVKFFREERGVSNLATIHLTTSADNPAGQKLYLKTGYKHVGNIPGLVGEGNTELVMLKKVGNVKYRTGLWNKTKV